MSRAESVNWPENVGCVIWYDRVAQGTVMTFGKIIARDSFLLILPEVGSSVESHRRHSKRYFVVSRADIDDVILLTPLEVYNGA